MDLSLNTIAVEPLISENKDMATLSLQEQGVQEGRIWVWVRLKRKRKICVRLHRVEISRTERARSLRICKIAGSSSATNGTMGVTRGSLRNLNSTNCHSHRSGDVTTQKECLRSGGIENEALTSPYCLDMIGEFLSLELELLGSTLIHCRHKEHLLYRRWRTKGFRGRLKQ
ncbi:hypothetical protein VNO77_44567 [Canavalia gladiata]|uniref:Uncharacterized protein n=1 Tax=Canavalia gladiata TaxID=3824 RepID=A0AAN9JYQ3_CANGL